MSCADGSPAARSREFDLGWKLYGEQAGEPVYFGDKAEGKFGCYFVKDGQARHCRPTLCARARLSVLATRYQVLLSGMPYLKRPVVITEAA